MSERRFSHNESLNRLYRILKDAAPASAIPGSLLGEVLGWDTALSNIAELFAGSLSGETLTFPDANFSSIVTDENITTSGTVIAEDIVAQGTLTFGAVGVGSLGASGDIWASGTMIAEDMIVGDDLTVGDDVFIGGDVNVTGTVTAEDYVAQGDVYIGDDLFVGDDVFVTGTVTAEDAVIHDDLLVEDDYVGGGDITISGSVTVGVDIDADGVVTAQELVALDDLTVTDDLFVEDDIIGGGDLTITGTITASDYKNLPHEHGVIYNASSTGTASVVIGTSWAKLTGAFVSDGVSTTNVTPNAANDRIIINKAGTYLVMFQLGFGGSANSDWNLAAYVDSVRQEQIRTVRKLGAGGDRGSCSAFGFVTITGTNNAVEVYAQAQAATQTFQLHAGQIVIEGDLAE